MFVGLGVKGVWGIVCVDALDVMIVDVFVVVAVWDLGVVRMSGMRVVVGWSSINVLVVVCSVFVRGVV